MSRRLEKRIVKTIGTTWSLYRYHPRRDNARWEWDFIHRPEDTINEIETLTEDIHRGIPRTDAGTYSSGTPLTVDELIAMDAIEDGLDELVETIAGLFVVEED